jgi:hypothetical protein
MIYAKLIQNQKHNALITRTLTRILIKYRTMAYMKLKIRLKVNTKKNITH